MRVFHIIRIAHVSILMRTGNSYYLPKNQQLKWRSLINCVLDDEETCTVSSISSCDNQKR